MFILKKTIIHNPKDIGVLYKIVLGLNYNSHGKWNIEDFNKLFSFNSASELLSYEKKTIFERLANPSILKLFFIKISCFWNDFDISWTLNYLNNVGVSIGGFHINYLDLYTALNNYDMLIWYFVLIFATIGLYKTNNYSVLINIILIGNFLIYLFIEVQGRYGIFCRTLIFIIASKGFSIIFEKFNFPSLFQSSLNTKTK